MITANMSDPNWAENLQAALALKKAGFSDEEIQTMYDEQVAKDKEQNK